MSTHEHEIELSSNPQKLEADIAHMKLTLDNLSYVMYKKMAAFQKMLYMSKEQIDKHYPEVKDMVVEAPEEPVLLDKGKFEIDCARCGKKSKSTGVIFMDGDIKKHEFRCDSCAFWEFNSVFGIIGAQCEKIISDASKKQEGNQEKTDA